MSKISKLNTNVGLNILNKNLYNKSFLRATQITQNNFKIYQIQYIENEDNIDLLTLKSSNIKNSVGTSINNKIHTFKNRKNILLQVQKMVSAFSPKRKSVLESLLKVLYIISSFTLISKQNKTFFLILNPVKAGFKCLSCGLTGFLPRKQIDYVFTAGYPIFFPLYNKMSEYRFKFVFHPINLKLILRVPLQHQLKIRAVAGTTKKQILVKRHKRPHFFLDFILYL